MNTIIKKTSTISALFALLSSPTRIQAGGGGLEILVPIVASGLAVGAAVTIASPFIAARFTYKAIQARKIKSPAARIKAQTRYLTGAAVSAGIGIGSNYALDKLFDKTIGTWHP